MTLADMADKGRAKLERKADQMTASWTAAKPRMIAAWTAVGFGPTRCANYTAGIEAAVYRAPDAKKWHTNWLAKMKE